MKENAEKQKKAVWSKGVVKVWEIKLNCRAVCACVQLMKGGTDRPAPAFATDCIKVDFTYYVKFIAELFTTYAFTD